MRWAFQFFEKTENFIWVKLNDLRFLPRVTLKLTKSKFRIHFGIDENLFDHVRKAEIDWMDRFHKASKESNFTPIQENEENSKFASLLLRKWNYNGTPKKFAIDANQNITISYFESFLKTAWMNNKKNNK